MPKMANDRPMQGAIQWMSAYEVQAKMKQPAGKIMPAAHAPKRRASGP